MYISLDLETTGLNKEEDEIIEFGAIKFDENGENKETLQILINPQVEIPPIVRHITKITDEDVKDAPTFEEKAQEIREFIGDLPIIGHNIQFDTNFLREKGLELNNPEYDTFDLASILITGMPSYSLEILSKVFNLKHEEKHRALDDAIAAMELFLELQKQIKALPQKTLNEIEELSKKTKWQGKPIFQNIKQTDKNKDETIKEYIQREPTKWPEINEETIEKLKDTKSSALLQIERPYQQLIKKLAKEIKPNSYISIPEKLFAEIEKTLPDNYAKLDTPTNYISIERLEEFKQKDFFKDHEFTALLKYIIWLTKTKSGLLTEVKIVRNEKQTLSRVNIDPLFEDPTQSLFYKKALEKDETKPAICTHRYLIEQDQKLEDVTIIDLEEFLEALSKSHSSWLKLEHAEEILKRIQTETPSHKLAEHLTTKTTILFGLIGTFHAKYNDNNSFKKTTVVKTGHEDTKEFQNIKETVKNIIELSKEFGEIPDINNNKRLKKLLKDWKTILQILQEAFVKPNRNEITSWIETGFDDELILKAHPVSLATTINDTLKNCENYKIIDPNIDLNDNGTFIRQYLQLPEALPLYIVQPTKEKEIFIAEDVNQADKTDKELIKNLVRLLNDKKGRVAIVVSSRDNLKNLTIQLDQQLSKDINLISQQTGALGKITEKFKDDPENSVLIIKREMWELFTLQDEIDTIIIHKIPFGALSAISATPANKENFNNIQIPLVTIKLREIIQKLPNGKILITDTRLTKTRYGKTILDNLHTLGITKKINIASLQSFRQMI